MNRWVTIGIVLICVWSSWSPAVADDVVVKILPSRVEAVIEHKGAVSGLAAKFGRILEWATRHGWTSTGPSVAVFLTDANTPDPQKRSEARIPLNIYGQVLPRVGSGVEGVRLERRPAQLVISTRHVGSYSQIFPAYERLREKLAALRLRATGPMREVYISDPTQISVDKLQTDVQMIVEPTGPVDVGVYVGAGAFPAGVAAASLCFTGAGLSVKPLTAAEINSGDFAKAVAAVYMPGGWAAHYIRDISSRGVEHLQDFVRGGGGYVGVCAGSFFAAKTVHWAGADLDYPLDLFPGKPSGPIVEIAPWPSYAMTTVKIRGKHPVAKKHRGKRRMLYYGGPVLLPKKGAKVSVVAEFAPSGQPAMVAFEHGEGRVFLSSPHIDYDLTSAADGSEWPENEKGIDDKESDWDVLQSAAKWVVKRRK